MSKKLFIAVVMTALLAVAVSAFAEPVEQLMVITARIKLYKRSDVTSPCFRYLDEGEKVSILKKTDDGWLKVGTAHKFESGLRMVGYINPGLLVVKKASPAALVPSVAPSSDGATQKLGNLTSVAIVSPPREISLVSNVPTTESQLKTLTDKKDAELAGLNKELEAKKKALADAATVDTNKDKAIEALRAQAADAATKLATFQASVESEAFRLLIEKATTVKLRGFGSVRLVPLLDDYLVIIPPEHAKSTNAFFAKIRKVVLVGKTATYLICDRKYFVPAPSEHSIQPVHNEEPGDLSQRGASAESGRVGGQP